MSISTSTLIAAPPRIVAEVLCDFDSYPNWNPQAPELRADKTAPDGRPLVGAILRGKMRLSSSKIVQVRAVISHCDHEQLKWGAGIPYIFNGTHTFSYLTQAEDANMTHFVNTEVFGGIFGSVFGYFFGQSLHDQFSAMNTKLKERAEQHYREVKS
ncbi:hypothetical protein BKA62DRAFT_658426 [Auriculariales sp. MPI-PUGE-AT-0066]|nr:hypothetical protein BKA62DRAFT_658426 [Auriculariales sp. MPI-PUGE-AT-0066]